MNERIILQKTFIHLEETTFLIQEYQLGKVH